MNLTPKQRDLMLFIQRYTDANLCSPSYEEMRAGMRLRSKSGIHRLLDGLCGRGYIDRVEHRQRAITIVKRLPDPEAPPITDDGRAEYRALVRQIANDPDPDFWAQRKRAQELIRRFG